MGDSIGCNFFDWCEKDDEEIQHSPISKCSKCELKDVEINTLRRTITNTLRDDNYTKEMMKNMLKMLVIVIMFFSFNLCGVDVYFGQEVVIMFSVVNLMQLAM